VGHIERFNPATQVAWKNTGPPKYIRAERVSPYPFRSTDIGVVHDLMIHDLDLVLDLANAPLSSVQAFGISILGAHEDSVQARLAFKNGCIADLTASRVHPAVRRRMDIWSRSGSVSVDFGAREVVCYRPSETLLYGTSPLDRAREPGADIEQLKKEIFGTYITVQKPHVPAADALTAELASFVDCVLHHREPVVDGNAALQAMIAAEAVLECVRTHRWDGDAAGTVGPFVRLPEERRLAG
jgi:predicted dehydrogenase